MSRKEEQKQLNRQSLLTAGMQSFNERGYANTSVEEIIQIADVSRATFYKHFRSKFALADALVDEFMLLQERAYDRLALTENPSQQEIAHWLYAILKIFSENKLLLMVLAELHAAEPALRAGSKTANMKRIRKLSKSFAAFRLPSSRRRDVSGARDRALLLLTEVDVILLGLTAGEWEIDKDVAIHFLAAQVNSFIRGDLNPAKTVERQQDQQNDSSPVRLLRPRRKQSI